MALSIECQFSPSCDQADFEKKSLVFTRYHVLDHGVTMANIRENVNVLLAVTADAYPMAAGES